MYSTLYILPMLLLFLSVTSDTVNKGEQQSIEEKKVLILQRSVPPSAIEEYESNQGTVLNETNIHKNDDVDNSEDINRSNHPPVLEKDDTIPNSKYKNILRPKQRSLNVEPATTKSNENDKEIATTTSTATTVKTKGPHLRRRVKKVKKVSEPVKNFDSTEYTLKNITLKEIVTPKPQKVLTQRRTLSKRITLEASSTEATVNPTTLQKTAEITTVSTIVTQKPTIATKITEIPKSLSKDVTQSVEVPKFSKQTPTLVRKGPERSTLAVAVTQKPIITKIPSSVQTQSKVDRQVVTALKDNIRRSNTYTKESPQVTNNAKEIQPRSRKDFVKTNNYYETSQNQRNTKNREPVVPIIDSETYVFGHSGNFHYSYEGGDGTKAFSKGVLKSSKLNDGAQGEAVEGGFSYTDKDGNDFNLSYTADENGYRPVGAHLPTPPPIPLAIQRALAHLATKTTPEPVTEKIKQIQRVRP